jgi:hypothetical protein
LGKEFRMTASRIARVVLLGVGLIGTFGSIGCQVDMYGMTLPSGRYLKDDVQYFAESDKFSLRNEEAALTEVPPGR